MNCASTAVGNGTNVTTGERETIGSIDPGGQPVLSSGTDVIAGTGINSRWLPRGAFLLGKRFGFARRDGPGHSRVHSRITAEGRGGVARAKLAHNLKCNHSEARQWDNTG